MTDILPGVKADGSVDAAGAVAWLKHQQETLPAEQYAKLLYQVHALIARAKDDVDGFASFYYCIHNRPMPAHVRRWAYAMYVAREKKKRGLIIEAFRGSTKTTALTITFTAWRIGKEPDKTNLLVQVSDDSAADNTAAVASIIESNQGWKEIFPHVVPDPARGWGASGYEIKRDDMPYEAWRTLKSKDKDPSLLGVGYKSSELIGKHPTGLLIVDDIHNEQNTRSDRELKYVHQVLKGTIYPCMKPDTWCLFVGTPWIKSDTLHYTASLGLYLHLRTPIYRMENGEMVLTWPEEFSKEDIERIKRETGSVEFARMYLLDLTKTENSVFKYQLYPNDQIKYNWVMAGGVDYAGTMDEWRNKNGNNDYFALCYLAKLPGGGAVVVDGILARCTQAEAEQHVKRAQAIFPVWIGAAVEGDGKGEDFIQVLKRNPGLKIIPMKTGGKGKGERLEKQMGPWLENGAIRISDAQTPFLNELRDELERYPMCDHDDALDSVYYALRMMPDVLSMPSASNDLPPIGQRQSKRNPFLSIGSMK